MARIRSLFDEDVLPEGFRFEEDFLAPAEEADLIERLQTLDFHELRMRGVTARPVHILTITPTGKRAAPSDQWDNHSDWHRGRANESRG
jgi:hypothetical protein